jgi:hypothetical protein
MQSTFMEQPMYKRVGRKSHYPDDSNRVDGANFDWVDVVDDRIDRVQAEFDARFRKLQSKVDHLTAWKHRMAGGLLAIGALLAFAVLQLIVEAIPTWLGAV